MVEFIFYHIEKCGGSSMRMILYSYFKNIYPENLIFLPEYNEDNLNYTPKNLEIVKQNLGDNFDNIKVILSHTKYNMFPSIDFCNNYKFTCIRYPAARVISHYYFFDFPHTKQHFIDLNDQEFHDYCTGHGSHIKQCLGIHSENDIEKIDERIKNFDFILVLENIENELRIFNESLNETFGKQNEKLQLIKRNANKMSHIKKKNELISLVEKYCTPDLYVYNRVIYLKNNKVIK